MRENNKILRIERVDIYQGKNLILKNISLSINRGEFCYLVGRTGSGKSSFLKTLYAEIPLKVGNINIVGYDLHEIKYKNIPFLRRKLGMVFQDFQLLNDRNIFENLRFVLKATSWKDEKKIENRIMEVLLKVGMQTKSYKFPFELSGGEQQRIAIARALLNDPELILADEPTGNLDPYTSMDIMQIFKDISNNGNTVIIATHDYDSLMKFKGKIIKVENSKLVL